MGTGLRAPGRPRHRWTCEPATDLARLAQLARLVVLWYYYSMKVALSIPDDLFESAETLGRRLGVSRSRLYATALAEFVAKHRGRKITERLDVLYAAEDSRLDEATRRAQARSLGPERW